MTVPAGSRAHAGRFVSLSWRVAIPLALVFAGAFTVLGLNHYYTLTAQYRSAVEKRLDTSKRAFTAAVRESANDLELSAAQWGASLTRESVAQSSEDLGRALPAQLSLSLDAIRVYTRDIELLAQWSVSGESPLASSQARALAQLSTQENRPVHRITCARACYQHALVPVISADDRELLIAATRSLVPALTAFSRIVGDDVAIVSEHWGPDSSSEPAWLRGLIAVTHAKALEPVLRDAARRYPNLSSGGRQLTISRGERRYLIATSRVALDLAEQPLVGLFIVDVTEELRVITGALERSVLLALGALLAGLALLLILLGRPLGRLRGVAEALPKLPKHDFGDAFRLIFQSRRPGRYVDEIDVLQDTALDLIEQLRLLEYAEDANRAKSDFLAAMSHEIRTPMNAILGILELHERSGLTASQRRNIRIVREAAVSLLGVINDILDMSKVEAGKLELETTTFDFTAILESVLDSLAFLAGQKGLALVGFVDPAIPCEVSGDPSRLRQVLFNLAGNAVKFSQSGTVSVTASQRPRSDGSVWLYVEVMDEGIGISQDALPNIFHPFAQAENSTTRRFGGTGLGLSICRRLVELMGGEIGATSQEGEGSTFWFRIPLKSGEQPAKSVPVDLSGRRVLIQMDAGLESEAVSAYCQAAGAETVVRTGRVPSDHASFVERCKEEGFHVVVFDLDVDRTPLEQALRVEFPLATGIEGMWVARPLHRYGLLRAVAGQSAEESEPGPGSSLETQESNAKPLAGMRILTAEDNATNQIVIRMQLEALGAQAVIVDRGAAALEALDKEAYDALLTDIQMPDMDGYALARAVRGRESVTEDAVPTHLPIVALTASALHGEEERCLNAGMDAYISKPTSLDNLCSVLEGLLVAGAEPQRSSAPSSSARAGAVTFDPSVLEASVGPDRALHRDIHQDFIATATKTIEQMAEAEDAGHAERLSSLAHRLKGSARTVGALRLADLCERLERAEDQQEAAAKLLESIRSEFTAVGEAMAAADAE